jgi:phage gpG-like protein
MSFIRNLDRLVTKLETLASDPWRERLMRKLAEKSKDLIDDGFRKEVDPYGNYWQPIQRRGRILDKSGLFRHSWYISHVFPNAFRVTSACDCGAYHEFGTRTIAARMTVPRSDRGLGEWQPKLEAVAAKQLKEAI